MTKLEKIEQDIASLSPADVGRLVDWLANYRADLWDQQLEADAKSGALNRLIEHSRNELAEGKVKPL
jgi:hypothetical protein